MSDEISASVRKQRPLMKRSARWWIGLSILAGYTGGDPIPGNAGNTLNSATTGVVAVSSDTFLSSLGVNTHVSQGYAPGSYVAPLSYLGVHNIRDGERNTSGLIMLHKRTGILVDLVGTDVDDLIAAGKRLAAAGALLSRPLVTGFVAHTILGASIVMEVLSAK